MTTDKVALGLLPTRREEAWTLAELADLVEGSRATLDRALGDLYREARIEREQGVGHAAASRGRKAIGYWRRSDSGQERLDVEAS